jgi:hypothetical protein
MNHDDNEDEDDRLVDMFEQYRDDETTSQNPTAFGRAGTGKTQRLGEIFCRLADTDSTEFIDPKGGGDD